MFIGERGMHKMEITTDMSVLFQLGYLIGRLQMEQKIQDQCERGKPILAMGRLYWLKDELSNLRDIIDDLEKGD